MREFFRDAMLVLGVVFSGLQVLLVWHGDLRSPAAATSAIPITHPLGGLILVAALFILAGALNSAPLLFRRRFVKVESADSKSASNSDDSQERKMSSTFVLEVGGTQPLSGNSDWRFFLTNCTTEVLRYVRLYTIKSEIGAYEIVFNEIPVMHPREKVTLSYEVLPRRMVDRDSHRKASLWDFALDTAGEKGSTYLWYYTPVVYRDLDDLPRDGGDVGVCFDLSNRKLKTEGAEYWRKNNYSAMFAESARKLLQLERETKKLI